MSEAKITIDDPRLTAYALGELEGDELRAVQSALREDPSLLKEIDELQKLGLLLEDELSSELASSALSESARAEIESAAEKPVATRPATRPATEPVRRGATGAPPRPLIPFWRQRRVWGAAASLTFAGGLGFLTLAQSVKAPLNSAYDRGSAKIQERISARMDAEDDAFYRATPSDPAAETVDQLKTVDSAQSLFREGELEAATGLADLPAGGLAPATDGSPAKPQAPAYPSPHLGLPPTTEGAPQPRTRDGGRVSFTTQVGGDTGGVGASTGWADGAPSRQDGQQAGPARGVLHLGAEGDKRRAYDHEDANGATNRGTVAVEGRDAPTVGLMTTAVRETQDLPFRSVAEHPLSTFSIDVDTASYSLVRRFLKRATWPNPDRVRVEEMINYFHYDAPPPAQDAEHPFAVHTEVAGCPWAAGQQLVKVTLKGKEIDLAQRPTSNLVFLIDVSGSMGAPKKLPLLRRSLRLLVEQLGENDRVAIVVYAGASGLVLPSTAASDKDAILSSLDRLSSGGGTNGSAGLQLAYETAVENFVEGGTNRVILCTDGDFNVGISSRGGLVRFIEQKAKSGVFLSVMGFGMRGGDRRMEAMADKGNGHYAYIDTFKEAQKVFVQELGGTLVAIAKDVKLQVEFNPLHVSSYRLIGYANRRLANRDFNDDTKDAGEIGAGHTVTALYQVVPRSAADVAEEGEGELKYQKKGRELTPAADSNELMTVKLRYKQPDADASVLLSTPVLSKGTRFWDASQDFRFASSVASFGMLLRRSPHAGSAGLNLIEEIAMDSTGSDAEGYRKEFVELVRNAKRIAQRAGEQRLLEGRAPVVVPDEPESNSEQVRPKDRTATSGPFAGWSVKSVTYDKQHRTNGVTWLDVFDETPDGRTYRVHPKAFQKARRIWPFVKKGDKLTIWVKRGVIGKVETGWRR